MIQLSNGGCYLLRERVIVKSEALPELNAANQSLAHAGLPPFAEMPDQETARQGTMAWKILQEHNTSNDQQNLKIKFDALASHDITYVGIIQTAIASGLTGFPVPYVLTNCHNSLCAVGGTINEDDHVFGFSAAKKFGGIFVPAHQAVIHQYMREMMSGCGKMILGSDSHTRYGALGTMAIGEGGGEIAKQLLRQPYDIRYPEVIAVYLKGCPPSGVGPQDVALSIIRAVFKKGYIKNKIMEFVGPGIKNLSIDFRNGIDVMTTETTCLSSIWHTDEKVAAYYKLHGRAGEYHALAPEAVSYYDGLVEVDLDRMEPMIAMPFHPSNVFTIAEVNANAGDILRQVEKAGEEQLGNPSLHLNLMEKLVGGHLIVDQGIIAGCAGGTFENLAAAAQILDGQPLNEFSLSVYPASQPLFLDLMRHQVIERLTLSGANIRTAFCGPCFGAGDVPANHGLSIRHTTRNFPNREGSKPSDGQISSVALMDARSIAATAKNSGRLTAATEIPGELPVYSFDEKVYQNRVYQGFGKPDPAEKLITGPNIVPWPKIRALPKHLLLTLCAVIHDEVTTTDELIPSGETSSYRSNPLRLAEFTLSRKTPDYVSRAKKVQEAEMKRQSVFTGLGDSEALLPYFSAIAKEDPLAAAAATGIGSVIFAIKPGDGSAREQAASCQRVLGADANIAVEYATKRYRSNLINWGMIPFTIRREDIDKIALGDQLYIPNIRQSIESGAQEAAAQLIKGETRLPITLLLENLSKEERAVLLAGCLINFYADHNA